MKQIINPQERDALPIPAGKQYLYLWRQNYAKRIQTNRCGWAPLFITFTSYVLFNHVSTWLSNLHQSLNKNTGLVVSSSLPFLKNFLCHIKCILNKLVCFSLDNLSLSVWFSDPPKDPKKVEETFFFFSLASAELYLFPFCLKYSVWRYNSHFPLWLS